MDKGITETVSDVGAAYIGRNADVYMRALGAVNKVYAPDEGEGEARRMAAHRKDIQDTHEALSAKRDFAQVTPTLLAPEVARGVGIGTPNADGTQSLPQVTISGRRSVTHELQLRDADPRPATDNPNYVATVTVPERQPEPVVVAEAPKLAPVETRTPKPISVACQTEPKRDRQYFYEFMNAVTGGLGIRTKGFDYGMLATGRPTNPPKTPSKDCPTLGR